MGDEGGIISIRWDYLQTPNKSKLHPIKSGALLKAGKQKGLSEGKWNIEICVLIFKSDIASMPFDYHVHNQKHDIGRELSLYSNFRIFLVVY